MKQYVPLIITSRYQPRKTVPNRRLHINAGGSPYVDPRGDIFQTSTTQNSINVFTAGSNGNVPPAHIISGSSTQLNGPDGVGIDLAKSHNLF
ncbi:MAG: hypothetical protein M3T49_05035, partial [Candidatus Eremiobacteraeota bacterium]|nr:hypothetical protein [Candidatus Eremiobacteraeota bacterium]